MNRKGRRAIMKKENKGHSGKFALTLIWFAHFGSISPEKATCQDCSDLEAGVCKGEQDPVKCILSKEQTSIVF